MAYLREIQHGNGTDPKQIIYYIRQLEEQVRYALQSLDGDNIAAGAIGEGQLSDGVQGRMTKTEAALAQIKETQSRTAQALARLQQEQLQSAKKKEGTLNFSLYIGAERPSGTGILWIKPGEYTDGAAPCDVFYIKEDTE